MDKSSELERQMTPAGRITYAPDVEDRGRGQRADGVAAGGLRRSRSRDSLSIHSTRRRSVDPALVLPPQFRTLSFGIEEGKRRVPTKQEKKGKASPAEIEFSDVDYHTTPVPELLTRFECSRPTGLTAARAAQQLKTVGPNVPSPPPSQWARKTFTYLFGGFGAVLFIAAILVFVAWKPLGQPPAVANLALAIVLILVWIIQAAFSFWQDFSSGRVMDSITNMMPTECIVLRAGQQSHIPGKDVVPGDLLKITMGVKLPADVRFVEASPDARFDRSILTGETMPLLAAVDSTDENYLETACIGLAGTGCVSGNAWGLVVETGDRTVFGRIAKLTSAPKPGLTPLQKEILYFVAIICSIMLVMILVSTSNKQIMVEKLI